MKRRLYLLIASVLCFSAAMAGPVSFDHAASKAQKVLKKSVLATENLTTEARSRIRATSADPAFYVFNAQDGEGFVIISGDDAMPEVVAYSHTGRFNATHMHPALVGMLDYYTEVVNDVRQGDATVAALAAPRKAAWAPAVAPLCQSEWGQDEPYSTLCPKKEGVDCPVGCVATALAQIMYHFSWPEVGTGSLRYASGISGVGVLSSNFSEHYYAWSTMRNSTKENLASPEASAAVAQLSYDCGIATRMSYDPDGSGTNDDLAMAALYTYFGYKASPLHIERRDCYATQEEWNDLVKAEINANRPVLYGGFTPTYSGHEFIIDGYDETDNFHVNWGWDGSSNGYYSIITLAPSRTSYSFSVEQSMVVGIEPDEAGTDKTPRQWRLYQYEAPSVKAESAELGSSFTFGIGKFYNYSRTAHTWTYAAALYTLDGEQLQTISSTGSKNTQQYLSYYGPTSTLTVSAHIPEDTPDGYYTLRAVYRQQETDSDGQPLYDEFVLPDMVGGSSKNNVYIKVENGVAYFNVDLPAAITTVSDKDATVVSHEYFDLSGRQLHNAAKGIVIDRQMLSNGKQVVKKILY